VFVFVQFLHYFSALSSKCFTHLRSKILWI